MSDVADVVYIVGRYPELSETFIADELREVTRRGVRVAVFALRDPLVPSQESPPIEGTTVPAWVGDRTELLRLAAGATLRRPFSAIRTAVHDRRAGQRSPRLLWAALWAARSLGWNAPQRVHAHFANEPAAVGVLLSKLLDVPFSLQAHGYDVHVRTHDLVRSLGVANPAIAPCEQYAEHLRGLVADPRRVVTIPVGVDPGALRRASPYGQAHPPLIACVARLVPKKGIDVLLDALAILRDRGIRAQAEIVGGGPLRPELEQMRDRLELGHDVVFHGPAGRDTIKDLLERAWLFVLPCRVANDGDRDSQPVALKEAMAMGVPVVSTEEVGIPELVDPMSGSLVPPDDARALADAMAELLALPTADRAAMGEHARQRVVDHFSLDVTIPRLMDVWGLAAT